MKNQIKQILTTLLVLVLPALVQAQFTYTINNGDVTITGYTGGGGDVVIPAMIDGDPVTGIGNDAFSFDTSITGVTIPDSVTSIGNAAFFGTRLTSVTIPGSVTNIGFQGFVGCLNLTNITVDVDNPDYSSLDGVLFDYAQTTLIQYPAGLGGNYTIPDTVTNIGNEAFDYNTRLTGVTIPSGVISIGVDAFGGDTSLTSVTIASGVISIGGSAFQNCASLTSVTIPASVTNIGFSPFFNCSSLTSIYVDMDNSDYSSVDGVLFDYAQTTLIQYPAGLGGSYIIPNTVTTIQYNAFDGATITSVSIPASVTNMQNTEFAFCRNLTSIYVDMDNSVYSSLDGVLFDKGKATLLQFPRGQGGSYTIPNSVTSIGDFAFFGNTSLTIVTIPDKVTSIGYVAFDSCTNLTSVTIPASVTSIGNSAFVFCTSLTSAYFLGNAPPDDGSAFFFDPATVYYLAGTTGWLSTFGSVPTALWNPFTYTDVNGAVTITGYNDAAGPNVVIPATINGDPVTSIAPYAFSLDPNITSVTIPASVIVVEDYAFYGCSSLTSAYFLGDKPAEDGNAFLGDPTTVYYLPGTMGWGPTFGGVQAVLWNPQADTFGFTGGQFGFNITGPANATIVVEACTDLAHPVWQSVATVTLSGTGTFAFTDPQSGNYPIRFYRFRAP